MKKVLFLIVNIAFAASLRAEGWLNGNLQLDVQSIYFDTYIEVTSNGSVSQPNDFVRGAMDAVGAKLNYRLSQNFSVGGGFYLINDCEVGGQVGGVVCDVDKLVRGTHLNFLIGHNFKSDGVYIFGGVRYYVEANSLASFSETTPTAGIGFRFLDVSAEVSMDFRADVTDYDKFELFEAQDDDWNVESQNGDSVVTAYPIFISLGYRF